MYSVDTNIYMDWWVRRYPEDVFPVIRTRIEGLITMGRWRAVQRVAEEIQHNGPPLLRAWAKAKAEQFHKQDAALIREANEISAKFPGMIDPNARHDEADRYVIALAKMNRWAVVTHETPAHSKKYAVRTHYIPDVCSVLGVPCIDLLEVMRRERWVFK